MRVVVPAFIGLLVMLAGCTGIGVNTTQTTTTADTTHTTTTADTTHTTTTADTTHTTDTTSTTATTTTTTEPPVYDYESLSTASRTGFHLLLENGQVERPDPIFGPDIQDEHHTTFYVDYNGTRYEIEHQRQSTESRTCLRDVRVVDSDSVGNDSDVGVYNNLSAEARALFDRVRTGNETNTCYDPASYPLIDYTHVRYGGQYYALSELHGSIYTYHYRIRNVSD